MASNSSMEKNNYDWLLGSWQAINESEEIKTYEVWEKWNQNLYVARTLVVKKKDTIFNQQIRLYLRDSIWIFETYSQPRGLKTYSSTRNDIDTFTVFNSIDSFPKQITYSKKKDTLVASSTDGMKVFQYQFIKQNKQDDRRYILY